MGRRRNRKSPQQKAEDSIKEIIQALSVYGVPPDAQQKIIIGSYQYVRQSCGLTPMMKMIWGEDWEPPQDE